MERLEGCFAIACEKDLAREGKGDWMIGSVGNHWMVLRCLKALVVAEVLWRQMWMGAESAADFPEPSIRAGHL